MQFYMWINLLFFLFAFPNTHEGVEGRLLSGTFLFAGKLGPVGGVGRSKVLCGMRELYAGVY